MKIKYILNTVKQRKENPYLDSLKIYIFLLFLRKYFDLAVKTGDSIYESNSFLISYFSQVENLFLTTPILFFCFLIRKSSWNSFKYGSQLRFVFIVFSLLIVFKFSANTYNFYFDSWFVLERLLLIFLFIASIYRPFFVAPLIFLIKLSINQYFYPLGSYSFTDLYPLLIFFPLFLSFLVLREQKFISEISFWRTLIALQISYYFFPGLAKLEIGNNFYDWILYNDLKNLFNSSILMGWLLWIDKETLMRLSTFIGTIRLPLNLMTVLIEVFSIYLLAKRNLVTLYLFVLGSFHLFIYLASGIFFWKWMVLNFCLLILFLQKNSQPLLKDLYSINPFGFAIIALMSIIAVRPLSLAWFDSKLVEKYEVELIDSRNRFHQTSGNFFKPYDKIFSQNRFSYLLDEPTNVGTYGSVGFSKLFFSDFFIPAFNFKSINKKNDLLIYNSIQNKDFSSGVNSYDPMKKENFIKFLNRYLNTYITKNNYHFSITPPHIHQPNNIIPDTIIGYRVLFKRVYTDSFNNETLYQKELINHCL